MLPPSGGCLYYAGLHLHRKYFTLSVLTSEGQVVCDRRRPPAALEPLTYLLREVGSPVTVTGEATLQWACFVLTLEDPHRFADSRSVGAYLGPCPRESQSGARAPQLRITKAGAPMLRPLLVTSAHYGLGPFGPDTDLRRWGLGLVSRGGANAKKRAVVAVARKLATLLHHFWVTDVVYQPRRQAA